MEYGIEIGYLEGVKDAHGDMIKKDIEDLGITGVKSVSTVLLYRLEGDITPKQAELICKRLLVDSIVQWYRLNGKIEAAEGAHIVDVFFKKGVTDAVGDSARLGIEDLGITGVNRVNTGCRYIIGGGISMEAIEKISKSLLSNSVIQDYKVRG